MYNSIENEIKKLMKNRNYIQVFSSLSKLYEPLDNFFKEVMVMTDNKKLKNNRIALLSLVNKIFENMLSFKVVAERISVLSQAIDKI